LRLAVGALLRLAIGALAASLGLASIAGAHPLAPSLLELREQPDGAVGVRFRTPLVARPGAAVTPALPAACRASGAPELTTDATSATLRWRAICPPPGLRVARVGVRGLRESGTDALLRGELADGEVVRRVLRPGAASSVVPPRASRSDVFVGYLRMGCEHLLGGFDHLLFVLGLFLLLRTPRKLLAGVTGFTLGHSVTLSLAALGFVRVPAGLVEIGIAASLFWLATRLARGTEASEAPAQAWRMPALFGLLHGLGFAGALAQAGLPVGEIPLALFAFNLGIELGQLAALVGLLVLRAALAPWRARAPRWLAQAPAYALGTLATWLVLERATALL
jgi:hypothetical protein